MSFRSQVQNSLLRLSYACGGGVVWNLLRPNRSVALMYHGVPTRSEFEGVANYWGYNVPAGEFEQQIDYLARRCNVLSLRDYLSGTGLSRTKTNIVITFDDGYANNCENAFRILEKRSLPALFAVATSFVRGREPLWNDAVEFAVNRTERTQVRISWDGEDHEYSTSDSASRLALYNWLMYQCVTIDQSRRSEFLQLALEALGVAAGPDEMFTNDDYRPLSEDQVAEMARSPLVEFASHSVGHYLLAKMDRETKRVELTESKRAMEQMTNTSCTAFCVPGGSYDAELLELAFDAGYDCVMTSDIGTIKQGQRVLNRNGVFRRELPWFADMAHGPVSDLVGWARRAKAMLKPTRNRGNSR